MNAHMDIDRNETNEKTAHDMDNIQNILPSDEHCSELKLFWQCNIEKLTENEKERCSRSPKSSDEELSKKDIINDCDAFTRKIIQSTQEINLEIQVPTTNNELNNKKQAESLFLKEPKHCRTSLDIISAEYDSNSDAEETKAETENQHTMPQIQNLQQYRTADLCEDDSDDDFSNTTSNRSSSSSSSSDSNSNSNNDSDNDEDINISDNRKKKVNKKKKKQNYDDDDDDDLPIEDLHITVSEYLCNLLGEINRIVGRKIVIKPKPSERTLDLDTILFLNKGKKALGKIIDVMGKVSEPEYIVLKDIQDIKDNGIEKGVEVYYCPNAKHTNYVFLSELIKIKGCDANDDEPVFSDDEQESIYEKLKQKNKNSSNTSKRFCKNPNRSQSNSSNKNRKDQFQRHDSEEERQQEGESSHFNSTQNWPYSYHYPGTSQQYSYQNPTYWQPMSSNINIMCNGPYVQHMYNEQYMQYGNYNPNNSEQHYQGTNPNFQSNMHQHFRFPFNAAPRFNSAFPPENMTYTRFSNASYPYMNMTSYPTCTQSLISSDTSIPITNANAYWSAPPPFPPFSLHPPPPPPPPRHSLPPSTITSSNTSDATIIGPSDSPMT
ncbi:H/ACA ribonucleoprotein complex non-core subunit NAF1 isoform X1 [Pogonomyrmex barbatus]|uniref:H/ACA ribonucleoprotein complex non-core subunit NAF1 n=1 Tax=Pogonomyrmex barbatus TaxID=144034 RepID=A0A6I9W4A3_9HYME|nr:H/ACA ribonucleoprotein complex non-core subunit NAF1 isoform X1 [Pogonomyrmex barbatus]